MKTLLHFKSEQVWSLPAPDDDTMDPGAGRLAKLLADTLKMEGYCGDYYDEDWMWQVVVSRKPYMITLVCRTDLKEENAYSVAVEPYSRIVRRWFRKYDNYVTVNQLMEFIEKTLKSKLAASDIRLWDFKEWDRMQYDY